MSNKASFNATSRDKEEEVFTATNTDDRSAKKGWYYFFCTQTRPVPLKKLGFLKFFLNKIKTPLRNRLKERHMDVCCKVAIDGPNQEVFEC